MVDLFFNTPARRKFLRADKTEFTHIDELLKRIALSRLDVTINLRHNGKMVRQYRAAQTKPQIEKRLAAVCGANFLQHALEVELEHGELKFHGWISSPEGARAQGDIQYCYVNGRMMKDKLINHAIRQGYESSLPANQYAAYILFIEINPHDVDVNVHPAKHEVRFHQARLVHDFIYQAIFGALQQGASLPDVVGHIQSEAEEQQLESKESYFPPMKEYVRQPQQTHYPKSEQLRAAVESTPSYPNKAPLDSWIPKGNVGSSSSNSTAPSRSFHTDKPTKKALSNYNELLTTQNREQRESTSQVNEQSHTFRSTQQIERVAPQVTQVSKNGITLGKVLSVVESTFALLQQGKQLQLLNLRYAEFVKIYGQLSSVNVEPLKPQPLLIPLSVGIDESICNNLSNYASLLKSLGIDLKVKNRTNIIVMAVCQPIRQQNLQQLIPNLLRYLEQINPSLEQVIKWLSHQIQHDEVSYTTAQAIQLVMELEQLWGDELNNFYPKLLKDIDITQVIQAFSHE